MNDRWMGRNQEYPGGHKNISENGRRLANVRGELIPCIRLLEWFSIRDDRPEIEQVVIKNAGGNRTGSAVDCVIGEHQTVIKSMGRFYRGAEGISGAAILDNGSAALILDAAKLAIDAEEKERRK